MEISADRGQNYSEYDIFPAITQKQKIKTWESTSAEWGLPFMNVEQYIDRKEFLSQKRFCRKNLTTWLYGKREDFEQDPGTLEFVSHCETYRRKALLKESKEKHPIDITCNTVAAVFTAKEHRGKGHASGMLSELAKKLYENSQLSNLYSDIGDKFYARFGWEGYPSHIAKITTTPEQNASISKPPTSVLLMDRDLASKCIELDAASLKKELEEAPISEKPSFLIVPSVDVLEWRWARDEYESIVVMKIPNFPTTYGALINTDFSVDDVLSNQKLGKLPSFIIWTPRFRKSHIQVLRARFNSASDVAPLIKAVLSEANKLSISEIILWNPNKKFHEILKSQFDAEISPLQGTLPSAATYLPNTENAEWLLNENYCWA